MADDIQPWFAEWLPAVLQPLGLDQVADKALERARRQASAGALFRTFNRALPPRHAEAALLVPERAIVPFHHRDESLRQLKDWCETRTVSPVEWSLLTGPTGRGKTRLLMQLVEDMRKPETGAPWQAGFLDIEAFRRNPGDALGFALTAGDVLIVVDYAERYRNEVVALGLASLALAGKRPEMRIRLVFVSRRRSELWDDIQNDSKQVGEFLAGGGLQHMPLDAIADPVETREALFKEAFEAFGTFYREDKPVPAPPDLSADEFAEAYLVHAAALLAWKDALPPGPAQRDAILDILLQRERRLWNELAEARADVPKALRDQRLAQVAAYLTLICPDGGLPTAEAAQEALSQCSVLVGVPGPEVQAVAALFRELYPSTADGWVNGVKHDQLGVYLLRQTDDDFIAQATAALDATEAEHALTRLNWLAQQWPEDGHRKLTAAFAAAPASLLHVSMNVAVASGDPIGDVAAEFLATLRDAKLANDLERHLPEHTVTLRNFAVAVMETMYQFLRQIEDRTGEAYLQELARVANNYCVKLSAVGRREEAAGVAQEAVDLRRALAERSPDAFTPNLALALNNLANRLSEVGRREEAVDVAQEAADTYRAQAGRSPDAFTPDLATSLNTLASRLSAVGRPEEAVEVAQEAVDLRRAQAERSPDAFTPGLAASLNTLASRLSEVGRREEAVEVAQEAVDLRRALAGRSPDAYAPNLALALNNLANRLSAVGRREEAVEVAQEAADTYRALAGRSPDAFTPDLAMSLNNLATMLSEVGRREEAVGVAREAVELYVPLAQEAPAAFGHNFLISLNTLARVLDAAGRGDEAEEVRRGIARMASGGDGEEAGDDGSSGQA